MSLALRTVKGMAWSGIETFGVAAINLLSSIILSRLLMPEEFGTIAMLQIFVMVAMVLVDSGLSSALIRKKVCTRQDEDTVLVCNVAIALALYIIIFLAAPLIARFYARPPIEAIIRLLALAIPLNALCVVQETRLIKQMRFKRLFIITGSATLLSVVLAILLAYSGEGIYALIWQQLSFAALHSGLLWLLERGRGPRFRFCSESFRELWGFGWKLLLSSLIETAYNNIFAPVIGKIFSPAMSGLYWRGASLARFPAENLTHVIQRVSYPALSSFQDDTPRLRNAFLRLLRASSALMFPIMAILIATASPLILTLFGPRWEAAGPYFRILCIALALYHIHALNLNLLQVKGRSDLFLRLEVLKKIVGVTALAISVPLGIMAICVGSVVSSFISLIINSFYTGRLIGVGCLKQLLHIAPTLLLSAVAGTVVHLTILCLPLSPLLLSATGIAEGLAIYLALAKLFNFKELAELKNLKSEYRNSHEQ